MINQRLQNQTRQIEDAKAELRTMHLIGAPQADTDHQTRYVSVLYWSLQREEMSQAAVAALFKVNKK